MSTLLSVDPNGWDATLLGGATREVLAAGKRMKEWKVKGLRCFPGCVCMCLGHGPAEQDNTLRGGLQGSGRAHSWLNWAGAVVHF